MNIADQFDRNNLHHAYMVVGDRALHVEIIMNFLEKKIQFSVHGNPDFANSTFETFGIDDARALTEQHTRKSFSGGKKICIVSALTITIEAQNALLKLFEEPMVGNHFFLIIPEEYSIIPTLRSRMVIVHGADCISDLTQGKTFLQARIVDRVKLIGKIVESKDKEEAKKLIRSITQEIHGKNTIDYSAILKDLVKVEEYLSDRAASIKMLLEHIAYRIPVIK